MQKRRLLKLASLLEADAKNKTGIKFDLGGWGRVTDEHAPVSCGTTACAMGLAVASGVFAKEGLTDYWDSSTNLCPSHNGHSGFGAAVSLFGISDEAAGFLFYEEEYPEGKTAGAVGERFVAKRIRKFVAGETRIKA